MFAAEDGTAKSKKGQSSEQAEQPRTKLLARTRRSRGNGRRHLRPPPRQLFVPVLQSAYGAQPRQPARASHRRSARHASRHSPTYGRSLAVDTEAHAPRVLASARTACFPNHDDSTTTLCACHVCVRTCCTVMKADANGRAGWLLLALAGVGLQRADTSRADAASRRQRRMHHAVTTGVIFSKYFRSNWRPKKKQNWPRTVGFVFAASHLKAKREDSGTAVEEMRDKR